MSSRREGSHISYPTHRRKEALAKRARLSKIPTSHIPKRKKQNP